MRRTLLPALCLGLCSFVSSRGEDSPPQAAQAEFFEKSVRPVLAASCFECHGPDKQKGGLRLDSRAAILTGGDSGPAVVPGKPEESLLISAIGYHDSPRMPPKGKLKGDAVAALTTWVRQGAPWPEAAVQARPTPSGEGFKITAKDREFWSFQPVTDPPLPQVQDRSWPKTSLDHFVLARLEANGLRPVAPADKRTWIRRVTFDLVGLPPMVEEIDAFLQDDRPDAGARVVDRLLASPHYGERWARHWLDVARYGEDQAHTFQARKYPHGYRYRDWLVRVLNDDMPYDRFIREQIAADLLDGADRWQHLPALGFSSLGPVYYGDAKKLDQYDDRIDTLTRGFLGLTVACARCHDHKFDPIPTRDYYALAGVIAGTEYIEAHQVPPEAAEPYKHAQAAVEAQTREIDQFLAAETARLPQALTADLPRYMVAAWKLRNRLKTQPKATVAQVARQEKLNSFVLERVVEYVASATPETRPQLAGWLELLGRQDAKADLSADAGATAEVQREAEAFQHRVQALLEQRAARTATAGSGGPEQEPPPLDKADAKLLEEIFGNRGLFSVPRNRVEEVLSAEPKAKLAALRAELERRKKAPPLQLPLLHTLKDGANPVTMKVHIRGNPETLGEEAPRRFLSILGGAPFTKGSGRLELAQAIAHKDNPLTARVMVNRVWKHHFGRGLVRTPSNFGTLGERPTHPELLDHLASRFVASGWSLKALHRDIVLSATYALGCQLDARNHETDPENRLLWRMNRRRLEVEAWRDAMLAVANTLDRTVGGPSLDLAKPDNRRRTLYAAVSRHELNSLLRLFDFPDPNITSDERPVTTVPLQQLFVLNSEFMVRNAKALAARLTGGPDEGDASRIRQAFLHLYGRPATEPEVQLGQEFLAAAELGGDSGGETRLTRWEQYAQVLLSASEFLYVD
jgi:cytochrome c553